MFTLQSAGEWIAYGIEQNLAAASSATLNSFK
jgi:hypothetical protein